MFGATCADSVNSYDCTCSQGYTGHDCETSKCVTVYFKVSLYQIRPYYNMVL